MRWSWKVGRLAGIELRIHVTFLLLLGWMAAAGGAGFILALFGCVVLHELGHSLAARRYGIATRDITLLPIGGVARLERMPEKPSQELWVALAGPAVNVGIATALYGLLTAGIFGGAFVERLLMANVGLVLFNLIPAFPMDGGRVLRAVLASRMEYAKATQIAAGIGQGCAFILSLIGLWVNHPMLIFVGLFVWIGAAQEASAAQMKSAMTGTPVQAAMLTDFRTLDASDTLDDAIRLILQGSQQDFPVMEHGRVAGILTRSDLLRSLAEHGREYPVVAAMQRDFLTADSTEMLEATFRRIQECDCHTMPVVHEDRLVGLLTTENLGEYVLIQAAAQKRRDPWSGMTARLAARTN